MKQIIYDFFLPGLIALIGGVTNYIYRTWRADSPWSTKLFIANVVAAFFIGLVVGDFIGDETPFRDGLIMLSGYSAFPILAEFEKRMPLLLAAAMDSMERRLRKARRNYTKSKGKIDE